MNGRSLLKAALGASQAIGAQTKRQAHAGVIPKAEVYRYERDTQWVLLRSLVTDPGWKASDENSWTRIPCMTAYQGSLFMGSSTCYARYEAARNRRKPDACMQWKRERTSPSTMTSVPAGSTWRS